MTVRCSKTWKACSMTAWGNGVQHGSGDPADWAENNDQAPWWVHADNWHDVTDAINAGLPVFVADTGVRLHDLIDLGMQHSAGMNDARAILIPMRFYEEREQQAIDSILKH